MKLAHTALADFKAHALACYPQEACGVVIADVFIPITNSHETPDTHFRLDPVELALKVGTADIQAVLHTHPFDMGCPPLYPPEWPTTTDMESWLKRDVPWGIASCTHEGISALVWLDENDPQPLVGRQFVHGINDCYSVIRDWFKQERGIRLKNFARGMDWWHTGKNLYDENFEAAGFQPIPLKDVTVGDCVMFKLRAPVTNHAAVVTGTNEILHHMYSQKFDRLSGHDDLAKWHRSIHRAVRYVDPNK